MAQPVDRTELPVPAGRSGCPINMTMELLGDRWSLVVLRDLMFSSRTGFRELLNHSLEGIASNVLSARLSKLVAAGLLTRHQNPDHRQRIDYRLSEAAIDLVPVIVELGAWGVRWLPTTPALSIRAQVLADGGEDMRRQFVEELRTIHLEQRPRPVGGVLDRLDHEYQRVVDQPEVDPGE
ncbi:winged helix-turn-helix transcriptional regulator [Euzebya rosea]|uniref:winged helix-turn-helix transcriptional regulator n=1 Tax=Euzebya rosea TaxID=2052804 RepID=UPI000D3E1590|nr:helix-turn-helix domain-containing protein [Euzebya rosea]